MPRKRADKSLARAAYLQRTYGITDKQYAAMLKKQGGKCAICGAAPKRKRLSVDHDHKTGFPRGLLCLRCNQGVGYFYDDPVRIAKASTYLEQALDRFMRLSIDEQYSWLPYAGRSKGKLRRKRIRKSGTMPTLLPPEGGLDWM
jgi:hypothetical protein